MYEFKFETTIKTKQELEKEVKHLLWKIQYAWPMSFNNELKYIQSRVNESWLKINGGFRKQEINKYKKD